ncbi:MAG: peptidylprolyl isomerase, partial [Thaumarchaeota archaeon]|nr:peptidylprolyl isomerase [Nitrososphaerota archaeon]
PYSLLAYANFNANLQSETYQPGFTPIYEKDVKYPSDGDGPLRLVHSSSSFDRKTSGPISGVFIYEVNKDYVPKQETTPTTEISESSETAVITTSFGDITIELKENVAPKTVENFKNLANSGFYDGTIFHRIVPDFVIQGGDPNTISESRDTWGQGGPVDENGTKIFIDAEFSDIQHKKYIVSMARGSDINSAGSQFFIVLGNSPWLDGKYTVFGEVISGKDIVDKIASLETNSQDQPIDSESAIIEKIVINS